MLAAFAEKMGLPDPLDGIVVGDRPHPVAPPGWVVAEVTAATVNQHDLWTLKGVVAYPFEPPVILGCDGAGVVDGQAVVFYPVLGLGESFRMLTDGVDGTFAPYVALPAESLAPKPAHLSFEEAAGLGTAWLTAWRMLFTRARIQSGERVLIQGAGGGVSTAAQLLAKAAGARVVVTSRRPEALAKAMELGADEALASGESPSAPVDVVIETVGDATWGHSLRALAQGGRMVVGGFTTGANPPAELQYFGVRELNVMGSAMGTLEEFRALCRFVEEANIRPPVSRVFEGVEQAPEALRALASGEQMGKIVVRIAGEPT